LKNRITGLVIESNFFLQNSSIMKLETFIASVLTTGLFATIGYFIFGEIGAIVIGIISFLYFCLTGQRTADRHDRKGEEMKSRILKQLEKEQS
jgi:hypothetical protein